MKQIDLDYDGQVSFSEFQIAACNKRALFIDYNVEKCFKHIDSNGDGKIDMVDLQIFLGADCSAKDVRAVFQQSDKSRDGWIDLREFSQIMMQVLVNTERAMKRADR